MATMSQEEQERADMEAVLECCISGSSPGRHISKEQERSDCSETDELAGFLPPPLNLASAAVREVLDRHESPAQRPSSMRGHEKKSSPFHRSYTERNMPLRASTTQPYSSPPLRGAEVFTGHTDSVIHLRGTQTKLVLGMVGLPARGKTYIAQKLARYLSWLGYNCKVFNIGNYRRALVGAQKQNDFFDPNNAEAVAERERCAIATLDAMYKFFLEGGHAAIYDGTNSTNQRREMVLNYIKKQDVLMKTRLVWVHHKSLALKIKTLGAEHPYVAMTYGNLAVVLQRQGKFNEAAEMYNKSLSLKIKTLGPGHPSVATTCCGFALLSKSMGNPEQARALFKQCLAIRVAAYGPGHQECKNIQYELDALGD